MKSWQAQYFVHLGLRLRGRGSIWKLFKGLGCCRVRGCGFLFRVAGAALWTGKCRNRGRRSTSWTWACVGVAGAAFGTCLKRWGVVARAAVGSHLAWQAQHFGQASAEIVAGAVLRAPGLAFVCQGQHLGAV